MTVTDQILREHLLAELLLGKVELIKLALAYGSSEASEFRDLLDEIEAAQR